MCNSLNSKSFSALGPAVTEYATAVLGAHARAKTVRLRAMAPIWLVCALHMVLPDLLKHRHLDGEKILRGREPLMVSKPSHNVNNSG
jgi:hypothetical protein